MTIDIVAELEASKNNAVVVTTALCKVNLESIQEKGMTYIASTRKIIMIEGYLLHSLQSLLMSIATNVSKETNNNEYLYIWRDEEGFIHVDMAIAVEGDLSDAKYALNVDYVDMWCALELTTERTHVFSISMLNYYRYC